MALLITDDRVYDVAIMSYENDYSQVTVDQPYRGMRITAVCSKSRERKEMPPFRCKDIYDFETFLVNTKTGEKIPFNCVKQVELKEDDEFEGDTPTPEFDKLYDIWDQHGYLTEGDLKIVWPNYHCVNEFKFVRGNASFWKHDLNVLKDKVNTILKEIRSIQQGKLGYLTSNSKDLESSARRLMNMAVEIEAAIYVYERIENNEDNED